MKKFHLATITGAAILCAGAYLWFEYQPSAAMARVEPPLTPALAPAPANHFPPRASDAIESGAPVSPRRTLRAKSPPRVHVLTTAASRSTSSGSISLAPRSTDQGWEQPTDRSIAPPERSDNPAPPPVSSTVATTAALRPIPAVIDVTLPAGARLPAALLESDQPLSSSQAAALDAVAGDFLREVTSPSASQSSRDHAPGQAWFDATMQANQRYRLLFGDQAANLEEVRAAREALSPTNR
jgi:hypothetical protein